MELPKDFFTVASMATLTGCTGATFVVCNGLQRAFSFNPRWLGLAVSAVLVLGGVYASGGRSPVDYLIGTVNSFLVYCSAAGATGALGAGAGDAVSRGFGSGHGKGGGARGFLSPWF